MHSKRHREEDDQEHNAPSKHARLEAPTTLTSENARSDQDHHETLSRIPAGPSSLSSHVLASPLDAAQPVFGAPHVSAGQSIQRTSERENGKAAPSPSTLADPQTHHTSTPRPTAPSDDLAYLQDLSDPDALQSLLETHGKATFQVARNITGKVLDHFSFKKNKFAGRNWRKTPGPTENDYRNEAGRVIHVPIVVQRGNRRAPDDKDVWWNVGPQGMVYMMKFVLALVLYNAEHFKKLKILTTKHDSDLDELRRNGKLRGYVQLTRVPEEESEPDEPCDGRLRFSTYPHATIFAWKTPRFMDPEKTYDYPHGLYYQLLGELHSSRDVFYLREYMRDSLNTMEYDLGCKLDQLFEREREEAGRNSSTLSASRPSSSANCHQPSTDVEEENTALATVSNMRTSISQRC